MDKRQGRFVLDGKKTMRLGTEIYTEIVEKMLAVHIAHMERKMKACIQCPVALRTSRATTAAKKPVHGALQGQEVFAAVHAPNVSAEQASRRAAEHRS